MENERLAAFQRTLHPSPIHLDRLRQLSSRGIPNHPPHLRPLVYSLLLEIVPPEKELWSKSMRDQRRRYHSLVDTLMNELDRPESSSSANLGVDDLLSSIARDTRGLSTDFWHRPVSYRNSSPLRPLCSEDSMGQVRRISEESDEESEDEDTPVPLLSRRSLFQRLETISAREHQAPIITATPPVAPPSPPESPAALLSPKITLSLDPSSASPILSRLNSKRPAPLETSGLKPAGEGEQPSPIVLHSPKPLPNGSTPHLPPALFHPDDNREAVTRLVYVFSRTNPQWTYRSSLIDIASHLYIIYSGGMQSRTRSNDLVLDWAEEYTFWALSALIGDIDTLVDEDGIYSTMNKFERRLEWMNPPLSSILRDRSVEPHLYVNRWFTSLFTKDIPQIRVPLLFDYVLSEKLSTPGSQAKVDRVVDIGVAMVLLVKDQLVKPPPKKPNRSHQSQSMWDDALDQDEADNEDISVALGRNLRLLRAYPLKDVGGLGAVLSEAEDLGLERMKSLQEGVDPDRVTLPPKRSFFVATPSRPAAESSWGKAVGSLWSSFKTPSPSKQQSHSALRKLELEASVFEHQSPASSTTSLPQSSKPRSDSMASTTSVTLPATLQEKFASLSKHFSPGSKQDSNKPETPSSLPRPLLLSGSAKTRRPSHSQPRSREGSLSSASPRHSPSIDGLPNSAYSPSRFSNTSSPPGPAELSDPLSPPQRGRFGNISAGYPSRPNSLHEHTPGGLYRIGSRQRSSFVQEPTLAKDITMALEQKERGCDQSQGAQTAKDDREPGDAEQCI
ncbi:hypothetical protein L202_07418 [Cryptococcus amylolentus CBS 6039]|uniref:Rab-GAP TBC domain-containing protein n=3 Tax=Cryptococcus amylolentus CBS 6039 TaxID=1295533 RepID=A0A1E3HC38_9TREE|nr:hypothetical protein L202_07418 [Cryptococcus amylolentus CBS 6039]ODN73908.1 hypothetical protein L202_07418 [Cryptococcus amylolentus CBS 6039]